MDDHIPSGLLTIGKAAMWSSVSQRTIRRWLARGLEFYQAAPGERVLIVPRDILEFLKRQRSPVALDDLVNETVSTFTSASIPDPPTKT